MAVGTHPLPTNLMETYGNDTVYGLAHWAYEATGGAFWALMLLAAVTVVFMALASIGNTRSFGYASFIGMIGSIWLATMQLMSWFYASIFIITGLIGIVAMKMSER